jgi:hypothetical protein
MITIEAKTVGRRQPISPDLEFPDPGGEPLTLRAFIERVVRGEVAAYMKRQRDQRFVRALTEPQIAEGVDRGRVDPGGRPQGAPANPDVSVGVALQAFEDGLYYVFVNGAQCEHLDEQIQLSPDSTVTFLRLVPLAGG